MLKSIIVLYRKYLKFYYKIYIQKSLFKQVLQSFYNFFNDEVLNFDIHEITSFLTIHFCSYCKISTALILKLYKNYK